MSAKSYYLGKNQQLFGPLSEQELENLKSNGQLQQYSWIWTPGAAAWAPLDAAPPVPPLGIEVNRSGASVIGIASAKAQTGKAITASPLPATPPAFNPQYKTSETPASSTFKDTRIASAANDSVRAILFDGRSVVTAWINEANIEGCELRSETEGTDPRFAPGSHASINLHDVNTGETSKVHVQVSQVFRREKIWVYKVRWSAIPALFTQQIRASQDTGSQAA